MTLDLREIPILILNLRADDARRSFMQDQLDKFGLLGEFVEGVRCSPSPVGCAISHLRALCRVAPPPPFLLLEDDCEFFEDRFRYTFEIPEETDALYLGHSSFGLADDPDKYGIRWGRLGNVHSEERGVEFLRVFNMLSRHAIVYHSTKYIEAAIRANERALLGCDFPVPGDVCYAELQPDYLVLAVRDPVCCQSGSQGGKFLATRDSVV